MAKATTVADVEVVGQGAWVEVSTDGGTTYNQLKGIQTVPQVGTEGSFFEVQDISEIVKRYQRGIRTPSEWAFAFARIGSDTVQDAVMTKAQDSNDNTPMQIRVTYNSGDVADFDLILNGFYVEETQQGDNLLMFAAKGQMSGDPVFTKVA